MLEFNCKIVICKNNEISVHDISEDDLKKLSEYTNFKISEGSVSRWVKIGNIPFFQKDREE